MILNKHTLDETRQLIKLVVYRFEQTEKAVSQALAKIQKAKEENRPIDEKAATDLDWDWAQLKKKWETAKSEVESELHKKAFTLLTVPANLIACESEYQRVLAFMQDSGWTKGTWLNIKSRLETLGCPISLNDDPELSTYDADLGLLKSLEAAKKNIENAESAASEAAHRAVTSKTGMIIGGAVLGSLVGYALLKSKL